MKHTISKQYSIEFAVQYHHNAEGGMDHEQFGGLVQTVDAAINLLHAAQAARPREDWNIVMFVEEVVA